MTHDCVIVLLIKSWIIYYMVIFKTNFIHLNEEYNLEKIRKQFSWKYVYIEQSYMIQWYRGKQHFLLIFFIFILFLGNNIATPFFPLLLTNFPIHLFLFSLKFIAFDLNCCYMLLWICIYIFIPKLLFFSLYGVIWMHLFRGKHLVLNSHLVCLSQMKIISPALSIT